MLQAMATNGEPITMTAAAASCSHALATLPTTIAIKILKHVSSPDTAKPSGISCTKYTALERGWRGATDQVRARNVWRSTEGRALRRGRSIERGGFGPGGAVRQGELGAGTQPSEIRVGGWQTWRAAGDCA